MSDYKEHWEVVAAGGQVINNTPEQLWNSAIEYFKWCDNNSITSQRPITSGKGAGTQMNIVRKRPYSIKAMCLHCGISERWIEDLRSSNLINSEWAMVFEKIFYIIYVQNLEGALIDDFNPMMVSKILKMDTPQQESDVTVKVEIVGSQSTQLSNSENEAIKNLDFGKVELLKDKLEKTD